MRKASDTTGARAAARLADAETVLTAAIATNATAQKAASDAAADGSNYLHVRSLFAIAEVTFANQLDASRAYRAALAAVQ